ncbi:MAG: glycoside hydrolase family 127 protein, partial [Planctomycetes bacterium]|nr:glycoside hydrolase family 127 protein [Planctomycetota bacterium]
MNVVRASVVILGATMVSANPTAAHGADGYRLSPVPFTDVRIKSEFWSPRLETNRGTTVPFVFEQCEKTGRISNFAKAGGLEQGEHEGYFFNDSDVYKAIEGASYSLSVYPDPELEKYLDELIAKIAAAQQPNGYLNSYYELTAPDQKWTDPRIKHELYCAGHLFEAAVAHHRATGKRNLLDVAVKFADHIDSVFGPGKRNDVPGHEEIEIGLVRLHHLTGEQRYVTLAKFFLDQRGNASGRKIYGDHYQDHKPVIEQDAAVGHAVRAGYLYSGMADVAAVTGEPAYIKALDKLWSDVVGTKLYITGGIGARRAGEAFGDAYELPNQSAYSETCGAIANALWNHRMLLLHGDAKYADVLERVIYNGFLAGVSLSGDRFFYPNPLAADGLSNFNQGESERAPWFACACCPVNVVRFVPSIAGYIYAHDDDSVFVNLYIAGVATVRLRTTTVKLTQQTRYPWDGAVRINVEPQHDGEFEIKLRIPGWATGSPLPSDLYRYLPTDADGKITISVNGRVIDPPVERGFARIARNWKAGDVIELNLPMPIRRVVSHDRVEANVGRMALERGPILYCIEAVDHDGRVRDIALPDDAILTAERRDDLLGGVTVIRTEGRRKMRGKSENEAHVEPVNLTAIPYYAWNHRGYGEMRVWLPRKVETADLLPKPTIASTSRASASHVWPSDSAAAMNDQREPKRSNDETIPRLTWWDHRGTSEWARYDFKRPTRVSRVEVYWFDDTGRGQCRLPKSWRLLYRDGDD